METISTARTYTSFALRLVRAGCLIYCPSKTNDDTKIGVWNSSSPETTWNNRETERELVKQSKKRIQDNILIPLNAVGMVIGKKGKNIKIIRKSSFLNWSKLRFRGNIWC